MKHRLRISDRFSEIPELVALARQMNIKRIICVSCLVLLFQALNLILDKGCASYCRMGVVYMAALSVLTIALVVPLRQAITASPGLSKGVFLLYWNLLFIGMMPFFISDLLTSGQPVNAILFCAVITIVPIFVKYEIILIFLSFLAVNLLSCAMIGAGANVYLFLAAISMCGMLLSYMVQYQYVHMIAQLRLEATRDSLTGILNRRGGREKMQTIMELCKRHNKLAVVYMADIDGFKRFNDENGHLQGDVVLKMVASAIENIFRRSSDMVSRFGGEEFVICSSESNEQEAERMGKLLLEAVENLKIPFQAGENFGKVTISIGYTVYSPARDGNRRDILSLLSTADAAMYEAKHLGKNRMVRK